MNHRVTYFYFDHVTVSCWEPIGKGKNGGKAEGRKVGQAINLCHGKGLNPLSTHSPFRASKPKMPLDGVFSASFLWPSASSVG